MPVSEVSGISGILPAQPSSLEQFADTFLKARQMRREAAQQDLEAASRIAEHDPVLAEEIGGKAVKELSKHKGQTSTEMFFQNIYSEAQKKRQGQEQLQAANIESLKASTSASQASSAASQASTAQTQQQTQFDAAHEQLRVRATAAEDRLAKNEYPETDEGQAARKGDALTVGLAHNKTSADIHQMGLTPKEQKEVDDELAMVQKRVLGKAQIEYAQALGDMMMQDPKTGGLRTPTSEEVNAALAGKPPVGLTSQKAFQDTAVKLRQVAAEELNASANMMDARSKGKLTDMQVNKMGADIIKELAQAQSLKDKGIKTSYDDLLKGFEALRTMKTAGGKPDAKLMQQMEDQLAKFYGGTPEDTKKWMGLITERGYKFDSPEAQPSSKALEGESPAKGTDAYEMGKSVRPAIEGAVTKGVMGTVQGVSEAGTAIENFIRGMSGSERAAPGQTSPDLEKYYAEQRKRRDERSGR